MEQQSKDPKSLHSRVNRYLREKPMAYGVEESDETMIEVIYEQLQKAEQDLKTIQDRVDRLKWELAKAKS
jgi:Mg2+ and Co2+ transporter CorA